MSVFKSTSTLEAKPYRDKPSTLHALLFLAHRPNNTNTTFPIPPPRTQALKLLMLKVRSNIQVHVKFRNRKLPPCPILVQRAQRGPALELLELKVVFSQDQNFTVRSDEHSFGVSKNSGIVVQPLVEGCMDLHRPAVG